MFQNCLASISRRRGGVVVVVGGGRGRAGAGTYHEIDAEGQVDTHVRYQCVQACVR